MRPRLSPTSPMVSSLPHINPGPSTAGPSNSAASAHTSTFGSSNSRSASSNLRRNYSSQSSTRQFLTGNHRSRSSTHLQTHAYHEARGRESSSRRNRSRPMSPRIRPSGQMVFYLRDPAEVDHIVAQFREQLSGPLGLDIEYKPKFTKGGRQNKTALVQLASDSIVLLVQVSNMSMFPLVIRNILEDPKIIKSGVGIKDDAEKLWTDFGVSAAGCLELGNFARIVDPQWAAWHGMIGLARLVKVYEDRDLKKPKSIQMSNWELFLTDEQQNYAADDANAGLTVYNKLSAMLPSLQSPPSEEQYLFSISRGCAITLSGGAFPPPVPKFAKPSVVTESKTPQAAVTSAVKLSTSE